MIVNVSSLILVGTNDAARTAVLAAAKAEYPNAKVTSVPDVSEAGKIVPSSGIELLGLLEPDVSALSAARAVTISSGAPRWGVMAFGTGAGRDGVTALPPEEWSSAGVGRGLRRTARLHELELINFRLRGDLSTLGRRISHDLRAPLTGIYSACDAINEMGPENFGEVKIFTQSITSSADELVQLIDRVSFLLKASSEPLKKEPALMGEIVFGTLQRLEKLALKMGATVKQPANWPLVQGVPPALEIMWSDLVRNALQHTGAKPRVELGWSEAGDEFTFWVDDHGPGVRPDRVSRLFQPFNLLHRLNATRGLGLSLVQRFAELQGGRSGYEPRVEGGSRFYFTLPKSELDLE